MNSNDIFSILEDGFTASFELLEMAGNIPNIFFVICGFVAMIIWILQMVKHEKTN